ncbi:MAG: hypothetical protein GQ565_11315 [Candidatus Aegiribacteria sp.]|nr:hypothetical protein [Candidatus Aegiribacteria sp.]
MRKKSRKKRERRAKRERLPDPFLEDASGIHTSFLVPGEPPPGAAEQITEEFQKRIKNSPIWKQMVDQFGEKEAERLLKQCKAEVK